MSVSGFIETPSCDHGARYLVRPVDGTLEASIGIGTRIVNGMSESSCLIDARLQRIPGFEESFESHS